MTFTSENVAAISQTAEFQRWFRLINEIRRSSGVRPRSRKEALAIFLTAAA